MEGRSVLVSLGSYERILYGVEFDGKSVKVAFGLPAHQSSVRCISSRGRFLVTGGPDEQIK